MGSRLRKGLSTVRIPLRTVLGCTERMTRETIAGAFGRLAAGGLLLGLPKPDRRKAIGSKQVRQGRRLCYRPLPDAVG
jgi:hypothetical protein